MVRGSKEFICSRIWVGLIFFRLLPCTDKGVFLLSEGGTIMARLFCFVTSSLPIRTAFSNARLDS